jgi:hypothetical protein
MKAKPIELTKEQLNALFEYKEGAIYWRHRHGGKKNRAAGSKAGTALGKRPYLRVAINYRFYYVHRLVWAMHHDIVPDVIDHIDGDPSNNRIENLRPSSISGNMQNSKLNSRNSSGIKGVSFCARTGKWKGEVYANGKKHSAGSFGSKEDCGAAVEKLRADVHGKFARHVSLDR